MDPDRYHKRGADTGLAEGTADAITAAEAKAKADKVGSSDVEITDATKGIILRSPNGTRYRITVDDLGVPSTASVV